MPSVAVRSEQTSSDNMMTAQRRVSKSPQSHPLWGKYEYVTHDKTYGWERPGGLGLFLIQRPHAVVKITEANLMPYDTVEELEAVTMEANDFLLMSPPKCGTHWMWEIMHMLATGKATHSKDHKNDHWLEWSGYKEIVNRTKSPRVLNTHLSLKMLSPSFRRPDTRTVCMLRNPKDQMVSCYHHCKQMSPKSTTWDETFRYLLHSKYNMFDNYLDHAAENWLLSKKDPRVLLVFYEDLKKKPEKLIRRVADHMGVAHNAKLVKDIADAVEINVMRRAKDDTEGKLRNVFGSTVTMYRKGQVGDWTNYFTAEQSKEFHKVYDEWNEKLKIPFQFE